MRVAANINHRYKNAMLLSQERLQQAPMHVLGIETSCDETAAAIIVRHKDAPNGPGTVLANEIWQQTEHRDYGGVVPEIAARAHVHHLDGLIAKALDKARLTLNDMDGIAATAGPGLIGGVMVGLTTGKALALAAQKDFIGVNHLEAHALTIRLTHGLAFPYLLLLISGGHCQLLAIEGLGRAHLYGTTRDDAVGEAFDKGAMMLGLGYPGGPAIEAQARKGRATIDLPRPLQGTGTMEFSFSGLKTAMARHLAKSQQAGTPSICVADYAISLQNAICDCLSDRLTNALARFASDYTSRNLVIAGGVAANATIRKRLTKLAKGHGFTCHIAPPALCTDNAAMIAWAGAEYLAQGLRHAMDLPARARWPIGESIGESIGDSMGDSAPEQSRLS